MKNQIVDYRHFRLNKINTPEFSHLKWLIFWPLYGLMFHFFEKVFKPVKWHVMQCPLDEEIPFNEWFFIPYILWFIYVFGSLLYTLLFDKDTFSKLMKYIAVTYTIALFIFLIYPSCQLLRPFAMPKDGNILTKLVSLFYTYDTNTNVFPSVHVIGSIAALYGLWNAKHINKWQFRLPFTILTILISISTVFMKQHSVLDVFGGIGVCAFAFICFGIYEQFGPRITLWLYNFHLNKRRNNQLLSK